MSKLDDLYTLVRLLKDFEFPVSPILEYAIKAKEEELCASHDEPARDEVVCVEPKNIEVRPVIERTVNSVLFASEKEEFYQYLCDTKAAPTARNYYYLIDKYIRDYIHKLINSEADSVYSFRTVAEIRTCINKLKANDAFLEENARKHNGLTAAINSYLKFLEMKENL